MLVLNALRVGDGGQVDLLVVLYQNLSKGVQTSINSRDASIVTVVMDKSLSPYDAGSKLAV